MLAVDVAPGATHLNTACTISSSGGDSRPARDNMKDEVGGARRTTSDSPTVNSPIAKRRAVRFGSGSLLGWDMMEESMQMCVGQWECVPGRYPDVCGTGGDREWYLGSTMLGTFLQRIVRYTVLHYTVL